MKRQLSFAFLSILSVFCLSESLLAQINVWRWQNPSLQGGTLNAVQMLSLTTTIACGNKATVMKTTDGGLTWLVMPNVLGSMSNFNGISFLDANIGMICGDSGKVLKTTDGGNSWNLLFTNTKASLTGIAVVDVNTAIVIGAGGTILETFDAGNSWQTPTFEGNGQFTSIRKLRSDFITITGYNGQLYNSTDIGVSWHKIPLKLDTATIGNDIFGQVFISDYNATVIGQNGVILHTISGGDLWQMQKLGDSTFLTATLNAVDGKDPNILAIVGDYGTVVHTTNGGTTWSRVELGIRDSIKGLSFFDRLNATAVGQDGIILRTSDGGTTWSFLPSRPLIDQLNGVAFNKGDTSLGIAVGHFGAILRTTNGGAHWDAMNSGTLEELKAVTFLDASTLIAVGNHGTVLKSTTAGLFWNPLQTGTTKFLKSVCFPTPTIGWAVGDSGIVLSTTNGGSSWDVHPFGKRKFFSGVSFPDPLHGYMCCEHGLFSTTDGGITWQEPDDVTYYLPCNGVCAPSANVVCIVFTQCIDFGPNLTGPGGTDDGGVMTSQDGGKTWLRFNLPKTWAWGFSAVYFTDNLHGTVVGGEVQGETDGGHIYHTIDGGQNWVEQQSNTFNHLYGVCFGTSKAGTAVGWRGNIMRITTNE